ncbi:MAG: hypothetical protein PUB10_09670 [Clostridiales bacterium]|nr:hypothetical protein [Clostridiales bacterium]
MEDYFFRLLYPDEEKMANPGYLDHFTFIGQLEIDQMVRMRKDQFRGNSHLDLKQFFTCDPEIIEYRLAVMEDIDQNPQLLEVLEKLIPQIQNIADMRRVLNTDGTVESSLFSIHIIEMYLEIMDFLKEKLLPLELHSKGFQTFQEIVAEKTGEEEYQNLKKETACLQKDISHIKSITVGINLNANFQAEEAGLVSVNTERFRQGNLMDKLLHPKKNGAFVCMTSLVPVQKTMDQNDQTSLNISIQTALSSIFQKAIKSWEPVIHRFYMGNTDFLLGILDDLRFLTSAASFMQEMKEKGLPMCRPQIASMEEKCCTLKETYNPMVALRVKDSPIVFNDFEFDENGRFYIITGPNHGGKSVFLYNIGMVQALFQLGMFVPAKSAVISPVTDIFTHFPASDENNYGKGRLESECERLGEVLEHISENSLILMDEAFSSTSGTEAGYIASEVITALGVIGCRGLFVTHIHDLPMKVSEFNSHPDNHGKIDNLAAQMLSRENGTRSYKIVRMTPDGLSYAKDIAEKYGLRLDAIIAQKRKNEMR